MKFGEPVNMLRDFASLVAGAEQGTVDGRLCLSVDVRFEASEPWSDSQGRRYQTGLSHARLRYELSNCHLENVWQGSQPAGLAAEVTTGGTQTDTLGAVLAAMPSFNRQRQHGIQHSVKVSVPLNRAAYEIESWVFQSVPGHLLSGSVLKERIADVRYPAGTGSWSCLLKLSISDASIDVVGFDGHVIQREKQALLNRMSRKLLLKERDGQGWQISRQQVRG